MRTGRRYVRLLMGSSSPCPLARVLGLHALLLLLPCSCQKHTEECMSVSLPRPARYATCGPFSIWDTERPFTRGRHIRGSVGVQDPGAACPVCPHADTMYTCMHAHSSHVAFVCQAAQGGALRIAVHALHWSYVMACPCQGRVQLLSKACPVMHGLLYVARPPVIPCTHTQRDTLRSRYAPRVTM